MFSGQRYFIKRPVALIGFMGAGKTSVAKLLSEHTGINYFDTDAEIVNATKKTVSEIINNDGEAQFRAIEANVFQDIINRGKFIISTGGGIVQSAISRGELKNCYCVWLKVSAINSENRIENISNRPMFKDVDNAKKLLTIRDEIYEKYCDAIVDTNDKSLSDVVSEVREKLIADEILQY